MMTTEEYECLLRKAGYLSSMYDTLYVNGSPVSAFDPVSPMICQSNQIAYNMAYLANANFSALPKEDLETSRAIMWASFAYGVVFPFCTMWLICDKLLPFF